MIAAQEVARRKSGRAGNRRHRAPLRHALPSASELASRAGTLFKRSLPGLAIATSITCALGGGYAGYQWLTHSDRFAITDLEIEGSAALGDAEVAQLLGLAEGANIFRTDMDTLEARLLASPWIADADVSRNLPNTLEITLSERVAVAAVELDGLYLLSNEGQLFKRATPGSGELEGLCIITGLDREIFLTSPTVSKERFDYALDALAQFKKNSDRPRIGELHFDKRGSLSLITFEDAIAIHLGSPDAGDFNDRFQAFDSAYGALSAEEHAQARAFRIADRTPSDRVTVAFAGN